MPKKSRRSSKKKIQIRKVEWFGLNHAKVAEKFEGDLSFVNYMNVGKDGDLVAAVYHASNPNREKGHKEFMLLWKYLDYVTEKEQWMVSGMELEEIQKHAIVEALLCTSCNQVLFSLNRHHFHSCGCKNDMFVDGGKDYLRAGAKDLNKTEAVRINLLTDEVIVDSKPTGE